MSEFVVAWRGERIHSPYPFRRMLYVYVWPSLSGARNVLQRIRNALTPLYHFTVREIERYTGNIISTSVKSLIDSEVVSNHLRMLTARVDNSNIEVAILVDTATRRHLRRMSFTLEPLVLPCSNGSIRREVVFPMPYRVEMLTSLYHRALFGKMAQLIDTALDIINAINACVVPEMYRGVIGDTSCFTGLLNLVPVTTPSELMMRR
jgi:hypothetical protein